MRFFLLALLPMLACGPIISHIYTKVGEQFVLGGQQRGAFRVKARNSGPVLVSVAERRPGGTVEERGRLEPGQRTALVRNLGDRQAELDFEITSDASL